jgi:hypothetical protein
VSGGLGPDCVVTEVGQLGPVSEQTIGVKGKLGVYSEGWGQTVLSQRLDNLGLYQNRP